MPFLPGFVPWKTFYYCIPVCLRDDYPPVNDYATIKSAQKFLLVAVLFAQTFTSSVVQHYALTFLAFLCDKIGENNDNLKLNNQ